MEKEFLTTSEVAKMLGYHRNSIPALRDAGKLPFMRLGKDYRYPRAKIMAIVEGRMVDTCQDEITAGKAL
jgi:excisionase family DNA binding protein